MPSARSPSPSSSSPRPSTSHPQTATRRPAPGAPRTFSDTEPAPAYDSINPPDAAPGLPGPEDDVSPPWYTWGNDPNLNPPIEPFFSAIFLEDIPELKRLMESDSGFANKRDARDRTPLYCAVVAYKTNINIVRCLLEGGAKVDDWSTEYLPVQTASEKKRIPSRFGYSAAPKYSSKYKTKRTPLMAACKHNHLPIARLLLGAPYNADPGLVAPDGQHALRLASSSGGREIVELLPSLRAGGWKRLKYRSKPHIAKIKKTAKAMYGVAKFVVFDIPKFMVCEVPRALYHVGKWFLRLLWGGVKGFGRWSATLPGKLYRLLARIPGAVWRVVKAAPGLLKTFLTVTLPKIIKGIYELLRDVAVGTAKCSWYISKFLFKMIFIILPELIFAGCVALCIQIKKFGKWLLSLAISFASLLHTFAEWLVRNCTWHNVMQGLKATLKFFFVDIPVGAWNALRMVYSGFEHLVMGLFGCFGCIFLSIFKMLLWFPKKFKSIAVSCGKIFAGLWKEFRVLIDPKADV